jgi:hypothetical protein
MKRTFAISLLLLSAWATPSLAGPGRGPAVMCYLWANDASPALNTPYTPDTLYSFNAQTGASGNSVTKTATGTYSVKCAGVGGGSAWGAGGHVQVSSYGVGVNTFCHVGSWGTGGPDFTATVECFGKGGGGGGGPGLEDSQFDLLFMW